MLCVFCRKAFSKSLFKLQLNLNRRVCLKCAHQWAGVAGFSDREENMNQCEFISSSSWKSSILSCLLWKIMLCAVSMCVSYLTSTENENLSCEKWTKITDVSCAQLGNENTVHASACLSPHHHLTLRSCQVYELHAGSCSLKRSLSAHPINGT